MWSVISRFFTPYLRRVGQVLRTTAAGWDLVVLPSPVEALASRRAAADAPSPHPTVLAASKPSFASPQRSGLGIALVEEGDLSVFETHLTRTPVEPAFAPR